MLQSPPNKRAKLDKVTSSRVTEQEFRSVRRRNTTRRSQPAPATGRQAGNSVAGAPSREAADVVEDTAVDQDFSDGDSDEYIQFERTVISPDIPPQQRQHSETADQNATAWDTVRSSMYNSYVRNLVSNSQLVLDRKISLQTGIQRAISSAAAQCPCCQPLQQHLSKIKDVQVLWVGSEIKFHLMVPIQLCHHCTGIFSVNPLQSGCFPSTPVLSWDITKSRQGDQPIWFDLSLFRVSCSAMNLSTFDT